MIFNRRWISQHFAKTVSRMERYGYYYDDTNSAPGYYAFYTGIGQVTFNTQREIENWLHYVKIGEVII